MSLADDDWAAMGMESKEKNQLFLQEFEYEAAKWREGPYGVLWVEDKITRRPTPKEVSDVAGRLARSESILAEK